jgi:hypothetical protein
MVSVSELIVVVCERVAMASCRKRRLLQHKLAPRLR